MLHNIKQIRGAPDLVADQVHARLDRDLPLEAYGRRAFHFSV